nr:head completion/stabilization protein [Escherichia coli]
MSMVARTNPGPAEDDITDTDDGDTRISAGAFWPDIVLRELRLAVRLPGRVTTSRLLHTATQRTRATAGRTHWIYRHRICGAM